MTIAAHVDGVREAVEQAARLSYGRLVTILAAQSHDIAGAEDALSDALVAALAKWPDTGVPDNPEAWLVTTARNRLRNTERSRLVRRLAEPDLVMRMPTSNAVKSTAKAPHDERLQLLFVCAHPAINPAVHAPLMLQTVMGLPADRISRAFLVEPATMSQRLVRAKNRIRDTGLRFQLPEPEEMPGRLRGVLDAIYATFGQGWDDWQPAQTHEALTGEAIWLARLLVAMLPNEPEPKGLLALMLYCAAREPARRDNAGRFVPLSEQDTAQWDRRALMQAEQLLRAASTHQKVGRYQCEAAIQSLHVQARMTGEANPAVMLSLYDLLLTQTHSIGAHIARALVLANVRGGEAAMAALEALSPERVKDHQPYWVARGQIHSGMGDLASARVDLQIAIDKTRDATLLAHLRDRLQALSTSPVP